MRLFWLTLISVVIFGCGEDDPLFQEDPLKKRALNCDLEYSDLAIEAEPPIAQVRSAHGPLEDETEFYPNEMRRFSGGATIVPLGSNDDVARAALFQTDGKMLVAGRTFTGAYNHFAIARFWPDGSLDTTFDTDGITSTTLWGTNFGWAWIHAITLDTTAKIVAVGRAYDLQSYQFMVARFNTDGSPDTGFHTDGIQLVGFAPISHETSADFARGVDIQSDGKIVVVGYGGQPGSYDIAIARMSAAGVLDTTYHTDGRILTSINAGDDLGLSMMLQADDKLVITGCTDNGTNCDIFLARYTNTGDLDANLHTDGIAIRDVGSGTSDRAFSLFIDTQGRYLLGGRTMLGTNWSFWGARYLTTGVLDTTFNTDGMVVHDISPNQTDSAHGILQDDSGRVILTGRTRPGGGDLDIGTLRLSSVGAPDTAFDTDGASVIDVRSAGRNDHPNAIIYLPNKLIVVGRTGNGSNDDFLMLRYQTDGSFAGSGDPDKYFNTDGIGTLLTTSSAYSLAVDTDGKYVISGSRNAAGDAENVTVWKFLTDGTLDVGFQTDGIAILANTVPCEDESRGVGVLGGNIYVGFDSERDDNCFASGRDIAVAKYLFSGGLDASFQTDGISVYVDIATTDDDDVEDLVMQPDGKIVLINNCCSNSLTGGATRIGTNGAIDTTFAAGNTSFSWHGDENWLYGGYYQTDSRIVIVGRVETANPQMQDNRAHFGIIRYTTAGVRDTTFIGGNGITFQSGGLGYFRPLTGDHFFRAVTQQPDGKLVAVGYGDTNAAGSGRFAIARFLHTGGLDTTFDTDGYQFTQLINTIDDEAHCVALAPNTGKIYVAGNAGGADTGIVRYTTAGQVDTSFDTDGIKIINVGGTDQAYDCAILPDGKLILVGISGTSGFILKTWD